jgi:hypothetical protein
MSSALLRIDFGITASAGAIARWDAKKNVWLRVSKPGGYL